MLGLPYQSIFADEVKIGERTIDGAQLKWSVFHDFPADRMYSVVQEMGISVYQESAQLIKNSAYSKYMDDAIFKLPTPLDAYLKLWMHWMKYIRMMSEAQTIQMLRGDVYEYLLIQSWLQSGRKWSV